jgi:hypothetical protein
MVYFRLAVLVQLGRNRLRDGNAVFPNCLSVSRRSLYHDAIYAAKHYYSKAEIHHKIELLSLYLSSRASSFSNTGLISARLH